MLRAGKSFDGLLPITSGESATGHAPEGQFAGKDGVAVRGEDGKRRRARDAREQAARRNDDRTRFIFGPFNGAESKERLVIIAHYRTYMSKCAIAQLTWIRMMKWK